MLYTEDEPIYDDPDMKAASIRVEQLAQRLSNSYPVLLTSLLIASNNDAWTLIPTPKNEELYFSVAIDRMDSNDSHGFLPRFFLNDIPPLLENFRKSFMSDALVVLADALQEHDYFGHDPALEMIYHLRNGVAHGNKFNITRAGRMRLARHPAHNRDTYRRGGDKQTFEITNSLQGKSVLFEYMKDGDILDLISEVILCMRKKVTGEPVIPPELR